MGGLLPGPLDLSPPPCPDSPRHLLLWPLLRAVRQEWPGLHEVRHTLHFRRGEGCAPRACCRPRPRVAVGSLVLTSPLTDQLCVLGQVILRVFVSSTKGIIVAVVLPVFRIKRNNGCETALQVIKSANERKGLLLLMPKRFARSLPDQPPCSGSAWKASLVGSARELPAVTPNPPCSWRTQGRSSLRPCGSITAAHTPLPSPHR